MPDPVFCILNWIQYWVPELVPDPVLSTGLDARSSTGSYVLCFLSNIGSGTGYQIAI